MIDAIYQRRSYHDGFDGITKVSDDDVEAILKAAMNAPSAMNEQPWEFVVVNDTDKLAKLSTLTHGTHATATSSHTILLCAESGERGDRSMDIGLTAQNIMLAATELGIGSLPMGIWPNDEAQATIREIVDLPESMIAYLMIALGYPTETLPPNDRWLPERVHHNRF
jgi:nitroreductase